MVCLQRGRGNVAIVLSVDVCVHQRCRALQQSEQQHQQAVQRMFHHREAILACTYAQQTPPTMGVSKGSASPDFNLSGTIGSRRLLEEDFQPCTQQGGIADTRNHARRYDSLPQGLHGQPGSELNAIGRL